MNKVRVEIRLLLEEEFTRKHRQYIQNLLAEALSEEGMKPYKITVEKDIGPEMYEEFVRD